MSNYGDFSYELLLEGTSVDVILSCSSCGATYEIALEDALAISVNGLIACPECEDAISAKNELGLLWSLQSHYQ